MVITDAGEDSVLTDGDYAANAERAELADLWGEPVGPGDAAAVEEVATPGAHTVQQVCDFLKVGPERIVKTLLYMAGGKPVGVLIRGDRELNESKLGRYLGEPVRMMEFDEVEKYSGAPVGFAGPVGIQGVRLIGDFEIKGMYDFVTGANKDETHLVHVCHGRDFEITEWADLRIAVAGDPSPRGGSLSEVRGIEVGHIFQLGVKYSASMNAHFIDADGVERPAIMGCYGLGISRCLASVAEVHNDADGLCWPMSIAPYHVIVIPASPDPAVASAASDLHDQLSALGVEVILDDRDERAGVKFKDADLIGWPIQVVVGRALAEGNVEIGLRREKSRHPVPLTEAPQHVISLRDAELARLMPGE
jgi:prolyl-tRNA synthetase